MRRRADGRPAGAHFSRGAGRLRWTPQSLPRPPATGSTRTDCGPSRRTRPSAPWCGATASGSSPSSRRRRARDRAPRLAPSASRWSPGRTSCAPSSTRASARAARRARPRARARRGSWPPPPRSRTAPSPATPGIWPAISAARWACCGPPTARRSPRSREAARARAAPQLSADAWARVVTASALRAYVPALDAHGAWAPLDEELSIYDLGLEADPPARLWTERLRTALGVRVEHGALPPLRDGDVVLQVTSVPLAGMSVEQVEQLSVLSDAQLGAPSHVTVLRAAPASADRSRGLPAQEPRRRGRSRPARRTTTALPIRRPRSPSP